MFKRFSYVFIFLCCVSCGDVKSQRSSAFDEMTWIESQMSPILIPGPTGSWNELKADTGNSLLFKDDKWWLYHSGQNGSATNLIGLHISNGSFLEGPWNDLPNNPILWQGNLGDWDEAGVAHPSVIERNGEILMYYSGFGMAGERIGLAKSNDGKSFVKYSGNPVISPGVLGEWDSGGVDQPSIIYDGKQYVMAYRGWATGTGFTDTHSQIGIATSHDGLNWIKNPANPILRFGPPDSWDEHGLLAPRLWYETGKYYLNYSGKSNSSKSASSIGHATATTLTNWVKSSKNPIIFSGSTRWEELEWGTNTRISDHWYMLTTAWADGGRTVLWIGKY